MYDYRNKLKGQDGRNSIYDILSLSTFDDWDIIKTEYEATDIATVKINGNTFSNYGQYQFIWEKSFVKSPERSSSGNIGNLNSYATFLTPHLIMDFSVMSIDDYRQIMLLHYSANEFTVECYDPIYNSKIQAKMYFGTEEMAKLYTINKMRLNDQNEWEEWIELVGVTEYKVELIGTNNELDLLSVIYHLNPPEDTGYSDKTIGEDDVYNGEDLVIGGAASEITNETFNGAYKFKNWNTNKNGGYLNVYNNGYVYTINNSLVLYAQWEATTSHILTYNYGVADYDGSNYVTSKIVEKGKSIGTLPVAETPKVKFKDTDGVEKEYTPYYNGQWYKLPTKSENSKPLTDNTTYWTDRDSTIYLLYDKYRYGLGLYIDGRIYQSMSVEYNSTLVLPIPTRDYYKFDGWYTSSTFQDGTKFSGNMPPHDLILYARWVAE